MPDCFQSQKLQLEAQDRTFFMYAPANPGVSKGLTLTTNILRVGMFPEDAFGKVGHVVTTLFSHTQFCDFLSVSF